MTKRIGDDEALEERSPTGSDMLMRAAKTTLSRANSLFSRTQTPCYLPPSIAGNLPHLTPGSEHSKQQQLLLEEFCADADVDGVQTTAARSGT